ncbi:MAG: hypothetical protein HFK09_07055 [Clostridia bacterium]|nr:hypothetical protein [Clostridia bacterium]
MYIFLKQPMIFAFSQSILPVIPPILVGAVSLTVTAFLLVAAVGIIKRQIRLYNSIRLVELKGGKIRYFAFMLLIGFFIFYITGQMIDPAAPERELMTRLFGMGTAHYMITLSFVLLTLVVSLMFMLVLALARSAVVDKGVYTESAYFDWYHIHDYIIDEDRGIVVLSGNKDTFKTLDGTTPPMRVAVNDIPKLKFILNKNKNKFSGTDGD